MKRCARGLGLRASLGVLVAVGAAAASPLGQLRFTPSQPLVRQDAGAAPIGLLRLDVDGGTAPAAALSGTLSATLSSSAPSTLFSPSASGPWSATCTVSFPAGQAASSGCFLLSAVLGTPSLFADAGVSWVPAQTPLVVLLEEDGTRGTILKGETPPGQWEVLSVFSGGNSLVLGPGHRGAGFVFHDVDPVDVGAQGAYEVRFTPVRGNFWLRAWTQLSGQQVSQEMTLLGVSGPNPVTQRSMTLFGYGRGPQGMRLGARNSTGFYDTQFDFTVDTAWHLVEGELAGLGTDAGQTRLWLDGKPVYASPVFDYSASGAWKLVIGEDFTGNPNFVGDISYDDVRVQLSPPASAVSFQRASVRLAGDCNAGTLTCVPLSVNVLDPDGHPAPAPFDLPVSAQLANVLHMGGSGTISLFPKPGCTGSGTAVVPQGEVTAQLSAQISGCAAWNVSYRADPTDDLLPGPGGLVTVMGNPTQLGIQAPGAFMQAGDCVGGFSLQALDAARIPTTLTAAVNASVSVTGAALYADASCQTPLDLATLTPAAPQLGFFVLAPTAGRVSFTAAGGSLADGTLDLPAVATQAVLRASATTVQPGSAVQLDASGSTPSAARVGGAAATLSDGSYAFRARYAPGHVAVPSSGSSVSVGPLEIPGDYELEVVVTDSAGIHGPPARVTVTVPGEVVPSSQRLGCGCSSAEGRTGAGLFLLALGALFTARRRRRAQ